MGTLVGDDNPFGSIDSSLEFMCLLAEAVKDARDLVVEDLATGHDTNPSRRRDAMRLVQLKLDQLATHVAVSRRILNDLRMLSRLLFDERSSDVSDRI